MQTTARRWRRPPAHDRTATLPGRAACEHLLRYRRLNSTRIFFMLLVRPGLKPGTYRGDELGKALRSDVASPVVQSVHPICMHHRRRDRCTFAACIRSVRLTAPPATWRRNAPTTAMQARLHWMHADMKMPGRDQIGRGAAATSLTCGWSDCRAFLPSACTATSGSRAFCGLVRS